jgi:tellurite resistance protein TehA-like permease
MGKPNKQEVKFAIVMSFIATFFVSFVIVVVNLGFKPNFMLVWMRSWGIAFALVALAILFLAPQVRKRIK